METLTWKYHQHILIIRQPHRKVFKRVILRKGGSSGGLKTKMHLWENLEEKIILRDEDGIEISFAGSSL